MVYEPAANDSPPSSPGIRSDPSDVTVKIAAGLGVFIFLYLTVTGIESLGVGEAVPTAVSRAVGLVVLLIGCGTAFLNAYLGGRLRASVANPLAIAVGLSLFMLVNDVFRLDAVEADLPTYLPVLFYLLVGGVVGLVIHFIGSGANRIVGRTVGSS